MMSSNINTRAAAGQGKCRARFRQPTRKAFVSNHPDDALKQATFKTGKVIDTAQFIKSIETLVGYIGRSGRVHADQLQLVSNGDGAVVPAVHMPVRPIP